MRRKFLLLNLILLLGMAMLLGACAAVKPYQREHLALRIMDFNKELPEEAIERHWIETLEASTGGMGGSGGGCACN
ncbi:DUF4266 domain-containing protein [candidate division KSB1 bacterium]|nr:MAG: DUF4266 domain-containing protein [candidate division KSB1 bacterium]MBC6947887.1 DUF4266 domain-containing protein [candidate division KSB1 bacterium]MCE7944649.1 DUF4266 domain-containing protein [Chlorobi bacterium CHB1]MDL1877765.1 DUF4266 domain-containing protein [Cytophagia bacterium CHB2]